MSPKIKVYDLYTQIDAKLKDLYNQIDTKHKVIHSPSAAAIFGIKTSLKNSNINSSRNSNGGILPCIHKTSFSNSSPVKPTFEIKISLIKPITPLQAPKLKISSRNLPPLHMNHC